MIRSSSCAVKPFVSACVPIRRHRAPDLLRPPIERGRYFDAHAPAVGWIGNPARKPQPLQPIDHPGDRAGRESGLVGQVPGAEPAAVFDDVEAAQVGLADAKSLGGEAVEGVILVAASPELADQLLN